ncbi:granulocyte-macrophage colony-stimulating factor receptor subunit alpha-like [Falco biarmicus]|uniref:granulocyte-macrophage colony-stimulating factor receptor subunit alpha-like n=1 Tax=Falco peregrinus TaxID=8954 RepID=UPI0024792088|nr:granulocyte-macrophage colony-stimulating factor receptor subunit alpha-like [Falco peregrinus]XP_014134914.2 granulocyte-macrophage colony-stimulating factor receptor subunit alpha-like [Falco cherrug]XP_056184352.1 granulocyte-macrophage colony-stimulating factor receptor subunit alpha-like [Falco biarmicus]
MSSSEDLSNEITLSKHTKIRHQGKFTASIFFVPHYCNCHRETSFQGGGMNGTAIENFVCVIFNVSFMNCTWHVGRTASRDTQYFLYWKTSVNEDFTGCQNYITDNYGRNIGCSFQNVTIKDKIADFLVNGSRSGRNILSYKKKIFLYRIEKLTPPLNVTVNCTEASHVCEIRWQPPCTSHTKRHACFKYEIVIENKADPKKTIKTTSKTARNITGNSYIFGSFSKEKRYSVKIRATDNGCLVSPSWGEWSTPVEFGEELTSTSYMLFLIPVLAASLILSLCTIRIYLKKTSPTIPQPKYPFPELSPADFQREYKNQYIKHETGEIITIIEEIK